MATEVTLPALGESVTEGTVTRWLKQVGDEVAVDEALLEVSTDKVDTEIPSPVAGTLLEIKADEDETVEVGGLLAVIGDKDESSGGSDDGGSPTRTRATRRPRRTATTPPRLTRNRPPSPTRAASRPTMTQATRATRGDASPADSGEPRRPSRPPRPAAVAAGPARR